MAATYNGYTGKSKSNLPALVVLSLKFNENCTETFIFAKKHNVRDQSSETPKDRTLFIQGLPPYSSKELLKPVFEKFGKVHKIFLHTKLNVKVGDEEGESKYFGQKTPGGFKVGYVVFANTSSVGRVLSHPANQSLLLSSVQDKDKLNIGLAAMKCEHNEAAQVDKVELQKEIDAYITEWDEKKKKEEEEASKLQTGDDGWEVVTRKGRNPGLARKESVNKHILNRERNKRSRKQLLNFYAFQIKESKMNHLESMRKKFEEDKQKIDVLKQSRRFKPF